MKSMGPKDVGWRVLYALALVWGIAIGVRAAADAVARTWPILIMITAIAALWALLLGRRR